MKGKYLSKGNKHVLMYLNENNMDRTYLHWINKDTVY